jgi:hypothetical protein
MDANVRDFGVDMNELTFNPLFPACLWTMNPARRAKMDQELRKWRERDEVGADKTGACIQISNFY